MIKKKLVWGVFLGGLFVINLFAMYRTPKLIENNNPVKACLTGDYYYAIYSILNCSDQTDAQNLINKIYNKISEKIYKVLNNEVQLEPYESMCDLFFVLLSVTDFKNSTCVSCENFLNNLENLTAKYNVLFMSDNLYSLSGEFKSVNPVLLVESLVNTKNLWSLTEENLVNILENIINNKFKKLRYSVFSLSQALIEFLQFHDFYSGQRIEIIKREKVLNGFPLSGVNNCYAVNGITQTKVQIFIRTINNLLKKY